MKFLLEMLVLKATLFNSETLLDVGYSDFKFYSDRLIRLLVEEGLNELPYSSSDITTPAGCEYNGVKYIKGVCGVSIMRSGEAMEKGLRECCRSIRIGKILIQSTDDDKKSSVVYAKFPSDINSRKILLMYPITSNLLYYKLFF